MGGAAPYRRIGATVDGSPADERVLAEARRMAGLGERARLSLIHVATVPPPMVGDPSYSGWLGIGAGYDPTPFLDAGRKLLERAARPELGEEQVLLEGYAPEAVCQYAAEHGLDLLVVGAHRGREHFSLGSFASYVGHHAPCPVLVARPIPRE